MVVPSTQEKKRSCFWLRSVLHAFDETLNLGQGYDKIIKWGLQIRQNEMQEQILQKTTTKYIINSGMQRRILPFNVLDLPTLK